MAWVRAPRGTLDPITLEEERRKQREWYHATRAHNLPKWRAKQRRTRNMPAPTRPIPELCELCGKPPGKQALNLDHCHKTGGFRGWLCSNCNRGIGLLGDDAASVTRALLYLKTFEETK